jgi:hypothetical protein
VVLSKLSRATASKFFCSMMGGDSGDLGETQEDRPRGLSLAEVVDRFESGFDVWTSTRCSDPRIKRELG